MTKARTFLSLLESTVTLFHGGRNLEHSFRDTISHSKGNWEYGPGLYLTDHYNVAARYAKGSSKLYRVTVEKGTDIRDVSISMDKANEFVKSNVKGSKRKECIDSFNRFAKGDQVPASIFLNTMINHDAIVNTKSGALKDFLVSQGVDYAEEHSGSFGHMLIVMNNSKIKKVEVVNRSTLKEFELPFEWK